MSQINFEVSFVGAAGRSRVLVPPDDALVSGEANDRRANRSARPSGVMQIPCSPLAPAKVVLRNLEKFPVLYRIHIYNVASRGSSRRGGAARRSNSNGSNKSSRATNNGKDDDDEQDENADDEEEDETETRSVALFVHPARGAVKPGKTTTVAVLLPPPLPQDDEDRQRGFGRRSANALASSSSSQQQRKQERTASGGRRVTFAGDGDNSSGGEKESAEKDNNSSNSTANNVLVRMKVEAVISLTGTLPDAVWEAFRKHNTPKRNAANNDDDENDENDPENGDKDHNDEIHEDPEAARHRELSHDEFAVQWQQGLALPTRTLEVISVKPPVTRDDYLRYIIGNKLRRCDRLARRNAILIRRHEKSLQEIEDFKAAAESDRLAALERGRSVTIPKVLCYVGVLGAFLAGFAL